MSELLIPDLVIELVFTEPRSEADLRQEVETRLTGTYRIEAVFDPTGDYHFFLTLVGTPTRDSLADQIFERARQIRRELRAAEANPLMIDSLYGAAAVASDGALANLCETPEDPGRPHGWVHAVIETQQGWQSNRGQGARVAIIDTGVSSHQELQGILAADGHLNLVEGGTDPGDRFTAGGMVNPGHGTVVASVVASRGGLDGGMGTTGPGKITGVAPDAEILAIRAFVSVVNIWQKTIPGAIVHAINQGADVIVMCMGGPTPVSATQRALKMARDRGILTICAAGNCWPLVVFPASYAEYGLATAVAALQPDLMPWRHSARGKAVVVSAPGEQVWAATMPRADGPPDAVKVSQGTTLATSLVAGAAALWSGAIGGADKVRQAAAARGTTGQELFNQVLRQTAFRPPAWGGRSDLGAGVLRISRMFRQTTGLAPGGEALFAVEPPVTAAPLAAWDAVPAVQVAADTLASADARTLAELDSQMEEFAPELLWRAFRAGSRAKAKSIASSLGLDSQGDLFKPEAPPSAALSERLETRPFLRDMLGM
ncbi:S8 family serine peptidase [Paracoccus sp. SSK6]|uniref:S8 family peptidase n=1 Tax=Paracoccus sp. SSK6 TaxID=3143131 RepID=UPI00321C1005